MKNLQGGFAPLLIIAIIAILAIGGGAYVVTKNKDANDDKNEGVELDDRRGDIQYEDKMKGDDKDDDKETKGSLRSLLALGKNTMCTFTSVVENSSSSGTVYIAADGSMSGDFTSQTSAGTITSHMIMKGGTSYVWSGAQGAKMNVSATQNATASNTNQSVDLDAQVDYDCKNWTRDDSKFTVPTNVNFIDIEAMMKGAGALPGGVDVNSMMKLKTQ
ncbi:MAG: hypothetical protein QG583_708 [Patescibacteria group bacterium]|nr:hypothetical protein [Patescibacteria group bacterium]